MIAALGDALFPARSFAEGFARDFDPAANVFVRLRIWHPLIAACAALVIVCFAISAMARRPGLRNLAAAVLGSAGRLKSSPAAPTFC